jgi:WD40 repeat protein
MEGHFDQELWGLCVTHKSHEFYTGGQDKLLIRWDASKRKVVNKKKMEGPINCLDLNNSNLLAVGLKNGIVKLVDSQSFKDIKKITNHKNPDKDVLSTVKFSPDGSLLAVGYCPPISKVYLYDITGDKTKKLGECKGASTRVVSVDFSMAGDRILATSIEPIFYKVPNCSQIYANTIKG